MNERNIYIAVLKYAEYSTGVASMLSENIKLFLDFFIFFILHPYEVLHHSRVQIHLFLMVLEKCQCLSVYFVTLLLCCW